MMRRILSLIRRFRSDERGAFLVIFGVMAIVLVATSGAVVDFTSIEQARTRAQVALDSAALGLQPRIYETPAPTEEQLRVLAENLLRERMIANDVNWNICSASGASTLPCVRVESAETDTAEGSLVLEATMELPMSFVSLVGVDSMQARLISEATRKRLDIEVAMVLDNSGSMAGTRMSNLKTAATNALNLLFYGAATPGAGAVKNDKVRVSIVPFTFFVNVGSQHKAATWIDRAGNSSIANDNFDNDDDESTPFTGAVDRIALIESMPGQSWKGCVETRPYPYSVDDTTPDSADPDTLFVPSFAPDEPGGAGNPKSGFNNSYISDTSPSCTGGTNACFCYKWSKWWVDGGNLCYKYDSSGSIVASGANACTCNTYQAYHGYSNYYGYIDRYWCPSTNSTSGLSDRELQERLCKYSGASVSFGSWPPHERYTQGPNAGCPDVSIHPLSGDVTSLKSKVTAMQADGGTNIHEGAAWGFRSLTPSEPFIEGRPFNTATFKVMIVMTDGENTYWDRDRRYNPGGSPNMNGTYYYMPYGYLWNERVGTYGVDNQSTMELKMNGLTLETCTNAKNAGITIYTIGLQPPNTATRTMLEACASNSSYAYFPSQPSELNGVFAEIVSQLSALRLAR